MPPFAALRRQFLALMLGGGGLAACGGGGGSGDASAPSPTPSPAPVPAPAPAPVPDPGPPPAVEGPAWSGFARDAQHSALSTIAAQDLNRIAWRTPVDLAPPYEAGGALLIHYGSPVITTRNTVILPVKTGLRAGFRVEARAGGNGVLLWQLATDYLLPTANWIPSFNLTLTAAGQLVVPTSGGRLLLRETPDSATGAVRTLVFYGAERYGPALDAAITINTPVTADAAGTLYFGFIAAPGNAAGLQSGIARVAADGSGSWVSAATAAGDAVVTKPATNCAPALSPDGRTLYIALNGGQPGRLVALDSTTLATRGSVALLDPQSDTAARLSDDSTSSPTVGPDGDVYYGVLETRFGTHNGRGWLLHFNATLTQTLTPGAFGWDDTASIVPAAAVASYKGSSSYLLMSKYNNYEGLGSGDGLNRIAILDPKDSQPDAITGIPVMREVLTILGPTPESAGSSAVKEWCINTAAVDPIGKAVLANSEDGWLYRWDLTLNRYTQRIQLTSGIAESYTPTAIGADGAVYAINNAVLFSIAK